jgi:hypothetical protein
VLRDWLVDSSLALIRNGFFHFVCFSGHSGPKQLTAIEDAGVLIRKSGKWGRWRNRIFKTTSISPTLISACSATVKFKDVLASPFWPDPLEHGGKRDTSIALAIVNDLVNPHYKTLPIGHREDSRWKRNFRRRTDQLNSYWGDPATADGSAGEKEMIDFLNTLFPKMRAVWEGSNPNLLFKSWYSILPPNKSFFKGWMLFFFICLFICGWAYLSSVTFQVN